MTGDRITLSDMPDPVQRGRLAEVLRPLVGETYADYDILSVEFSDIACVENADGTFSPVVYLGNEVQQWPLDDEGGTAAYVEMAVIDIDGNSDNVSSDLTPADFSAFASILSVRSIDIATEEDTPAVFSDPIEATAEVRALPELTDTKLSTFEYNLTSPWLSQCWFEPMGKRLGDYDNDSVLYEWLFAKGVPNSVVAEGSTLEINYNIDGALPLETNGVLALEAGAGNTLISDNGDFVLLKFVGVEYEIDIPLSVQDFFVIASRGGISDNYNEYQPKGMIGVQGSWISDVPDMDRYVILEDWYNI